MSRATLLALVALAPPALASEPVAPATRWIAADPGNLSARAARDVRRVVVHTIEGSEGAGIATFRDPTARVSAHYVVSHTGRVTQMVREQDIAWHAGNWAYNRDSIGIENEGYAGRDDWTDDQYRALAELVRAICDRHGIPKDRRHVIGHDEVPDQDHWDPGPRFDWGRLMTLIGGDPAPPAAGPTTRHVVRAGETLSSIAAAYGTTPGALVALNDLADPDVLRVGQELRVPAQVYAVEVTAAALNVRDGPWGAILGRAPRGARYVVQGRRGGWLRIDFGGQAGWVSAGYTARTRAEAVEVTAAGLNVRAGPAGDAARVGLVRRGQAYVVLERSGAWVRIRLDGGTGWVHEAYTTAALRP